MKTFLQICKDAIEETGISGSGPVSVTTAKGIEKRMVGWVRQAWIDIQQYRPDWPWMFKEFSFNTSPNKSRYPCSELLLTDVEKWDFDGASIFKTADGVQGEAPIGSITFDKWWKSYRMGEQTPADPGFLFVDPGNNDLMVYPDPDADYTITLRYYRALQYLSANTDVPLMPTNVAWQEIIKWRALWYYGFHDGAPDTFSEAEVMYDSMIHALDNRYGSSINIALVPIA